MRNVLQYVFGAIFLFAIAASAQTNIQFTATRVNEEGAIRFDWQSRSNAIYRIDYLSEFQNSNNVWKTLYEDYPSHGTNTFKLDAGDYYKTPVITHPNAGSKRFYRIVETGTNTAPKPFVTITSPTNSAIISGEMIVSITATSSLPILQTHLYLDGDEIESDDGTNFVINTCEWANGEHTLFAVAKAVSDWSGVSRSFGTISNSYAVSSYVPVTFNNFISRISFSEHFFEPDLGQTQRVSAVFGAPADWTLEIVDEETNVIRTATGTGLDMVFDWDGTDDNTNSIPNGIYYYSISAAENTSLAFSLNSQTSSFEVEPEYEEIYLPLPPLPGETETQFLVTSRPKGIISLLSLNQSGYIADFGVEDSFSSSSSSSGSQQAPLAPKRKPIKPVKGAVGTFGVAYYTFKDGSSNALSPHNGITSRVSLDGKPNTDLWSSPPVVEFKKGAEGFAKEMQKGGWKLGFNKSDNDLYAKELLRNDIAGIGGSNLFNSVNVGLFMSHGVIGQIKTSHLWALQNQPV